MNWQPIETAPKDGTWILAYSPEIYEHWTPPTPYCLVQFCDGEWIDDTSSSCKPTHWCEILGPVAE